MTDLSIKDKEFMSRVLETPSGVYEERVWALGFQSMEKVFDAGCGFGQWSLALAKHNSYVAAADVNTKRIEIAQSIAEKRRIKNISFFQEDIESLSFKDREFSGIFSYSSVYYTNYYKTLLEFSRVLKKNGLLYLNTNDIGWYLHCILNEPNKSDEYDPRQEGINAITNSINFYANNSHELGVNIIMPKQHVLSYLKKIGFDILAHGSDGSCSINNHKPVSFYPELHCGHTGVYEILCKKIS